MLCYVWLHSPITPCWSQIPVDQWDALKKQLLTLISSSSRSSKPQIFGAAPVLDTKQPRPSAGQLQVSRRLVTSFAARLYSKCKHEASTACICMEGLHSHSHYQHQQLRKLQPQSHDQLRDCSFSACCLCRGTRLLWKQRLLTCHRRQAHWWPLTAELWSSHSKG